MYISAEKRMRGVSVSAPQKPWLVVAVTFLAALVLLRWSGHAPHLPNDDDEDVYKTTHMCDALGVCGEVPSISSPRTKFSAKSKEQYHRWWATHDALKASALEFSKTISETPNENNKQLPLVFLGDSITESWLGVNMGIPEKRCIGIPQVLKKRFGSDLFNTLVLAIGGDQTQHLLYRLEHGELPSKVAARPDAIFVVMIGTNNIGSGNLPKETGEGVWKVADFLLTHTNGRVILLHLLPRGDNFKLERLCPPRCDKKGQPFASFSPAIDKVNQAIHDFVPKLQHQYGKERLSQTDCGEPFLSNNDNSLNKEVVDTLMPDKLHPNTAGHELLASCILDCINRKTC